MTPAAALATGNGGTSAPDLCLCLVVSSVTNPVSPGFASSALQVESSEMNKKAYKDKVCAKCYGRHRCGKGRKRCERTRRFLGGWENQGVGVCVSVKIPTGCWKTLFSGLGKSEY